MGKFKIGVGLWCVSFAADRFLSTGYRPPQSLEQQIRMVSRIPGAESIDLHTSDFEGVNTKYVAKMVRDYKLKVNAVNANIFGKPIYMFGAFTNTDEKVRRKAITRFSRKRRSYSPASRSPYRRGWP